MLVEGDFVMTISSPVWIGQVLVPYGEVVSLFGYTQVQWIGSVHQGWFHTHNLVKLKLDEEQKAILVLATL